MQLAVLLDDVTIAASASLAEQVFENSWIWAQWEMKMKKEKIGKAKVGRSLRPASSCNAQCNAAFHVLITSRMVQKVEATDESDIKAIRLLFLFCRTKRQNKLSSILKDSSGWQHLVCLLLASGLSTLTIFFHPFSSSSSIYFCYILSSFLSSSSSSFFTLLTIIYSIFLPSFFALNSLLLADVDLAVSIAEEGKRKQGRCGCVSVVSGAWKKDFNDRNRWLNNHQPTST